MPTASVLMRSSSVCVRVHACVCACAFVLVRVCVHVCACVCVCVNAYTYANTRVSSLHCQKASVLSPTPLFNSTDF